MLFQLNNKNRRTFHVSARYCKCEIRFNNVKFILIKNSIQFKDNEIRDVVVPALAESLSEGDIRWMKAVGDQVNEDEVVAEVETDKVFFPYLF